MTVARIERMLAACVYLAKDKGPWGLSRLNAEIHEGRLGPGEFKSWSVAAPAIFFSALGAGSVDSDRRPLDGEQDWEIDVRQRWKLAAFCAASGIPEIRGPQCRRMAEIVAARVELQNWARACQAELAAPQGPLGPDPSYLCGPPGGIRAENLFTKDSEGLKLSIWGVFWEIDIWTPVASGELPEPAALPSELYASWEPDTGPDHRRDYELVGEAGQ